ncbi:MAG TPA: ribbon-helix-helix protein, CopG family [Ignisphaera aggregans]|uniref:Ribbon-helix-helix protein, CopG family n=1 Tax=Ignisphaera aggregans TaxID=334771 RepID=A0A833DSQ1_9CREN|nr:ribbon-helix-helix protein, CopG family [Ignisphaera aggregans]
MSLKSGTQRGNVIEINIGYTKVISVKLDLSLLKELDDTYRRYNFQSRSELIREALRLYLTLLQKYGREKLLQMLNGTEG